MTSLAHHERVLLAALAEQLGPDAPTLCGDWTVRELLAHLVVRESNPAALGIVLPPLAGAVDEAMRRQQERPFSDLVKAVRHGPPFWSPFAVPKLGAAMNTMEFFIHHEDVRRAQEDWSPRGLPRKTEDVIWRTLAVAGRLLAVRAPHPVTLERPDTGASMTLKRGEGVTIVGPPSEAAVYLYGRQRHARVDVRGDAHLVARFHGADLGI